MLNISLQTKISGDGSTTLYRADLDEHYHSIHGAIQESEHVFIRAGLEMINKATVDVLEVGFGTGLNALLTLLHHPLGRVSYHSIEKFPLPAYLVQDLNYPELLGAEAFEGLFHALHNVPWGSSQPITEHFHLTKFQMDLLDFKAENCYDLVYFDAFAPEKQPELWSNQIFEGLFCAMRPGGILTTYCAKGSVRRAMIAAGFRVERLPGPPGKRQMLRAFKLPES